MRRPGADASTCSSRSATSQGVAPERFDAVLHRVRTKLEVMAELGADDVPGLLERRPDAVDDPDLTAEQLHRVGELAAEYGVTVAFEALAWGAHINRVGQAWDAVRRARTTRRSRWPSTRSTCSRAGTTAPRWPASPATGSGSSRWPTRRCST